MRSEIGKLTLDQTFEEREKINNNILENLTQASEKWGIECLRYEIRDIKVSEAIRKVMNLEAESERRKRAEILKSEGKKTS
jgi:regulator of protease activity HflC (stomatin/prohibitin superfamily)